RSSNCHVLFLPDAVPDSVAGMDSGRIRFASCSEERARGQKWHGTDCSTTARICCRDRAVEPERYGFVELCAGNEPHKGGDHFGTAWMGLPAAGRMGLPRGRNRGAQGWSQSRRNLRRGFTKRRAASRCKGGGGIRGTSDLCRRHSYECGSRADKSVL